MQYARIPSTHGDLTVSRLVFGCWGITSDFHWGDRDESASIATIEAAIGAGVNFFDTAAMYADGASEKLLGRVFRGRREQVVIASKARPDAMSADGIVAACERSLANLGTDYLDLYQTHWFADRAIPPEDSWAAMVKLREQGKVRAIGVCNAGVGDLDAVVSTGPAPVTNQLPYNLIWRMIEAEILPACRERKVGVLVYSPLMHGFLAGKYASAAHVPDGRARSRHFATARELARHGEDGCEEATFAAIAAVGEVAARLDRSMADVALAWLFARPGVTGVIVGASSPEQVASNVETLERPLPADAVARLDEGTRELAEILGPNPDMWQGSESSRFR